MCIWRLMMWRQLSIISYVMLFCSLHPHVSCFALHFLPLSAFPPFVSAHMCCISVPVYVCLCFPRQSLRVRLRLLVLTSCHVLPAFAAFVFVLFLFLLCC